MPLLLSLVSGVLLALSFPRYGHPAAGWVALLPLLVSIAGPWSPGMTLGRAWWLGLSAGVVYFGGTVYWTSGVMARYGGIASPVAIAIAALLVAYLALFPAAFAAIVRQLVRRLGASALLLAPAVWVATEIARTRLFGGFPWALLGYSQTSVLPVAQMASVTGVYGISAMLALVSAAGALLTIERSRRSAAAVVVAVALAAAAAAWGRIRLAESDLAHAGTSLRVGLVQGNVPQDEKWDAQFADRILERYVRLSREAAEAGSQLVLWPESATPFYFEESPKGEAIRLLARERGTWLLVGSNEYDRSRPPVSHNSAFLVAPDGRTVGVYRKVQLVPFGEYVPLRRLLFFAAPLVEAVGDFAPGAGPVRLPLPGGGMSAAICYEVVYPALIRASVLQGSALLTTITNDAWFGRSSAPYQHFEMAAMRAIEQGRYLVRAANTGISGIVDPYGRVLQASGLFTEEVLVGEVRLLTALTPYARTGDVVAWGALALTIVALAASRRRRDE